MGSVGLGRDAADRAGEGVGVEMSGRATLTAEGVDQTETGRLHGEGREGLVGMDVCCDVDENLIRRRPDGGLSLRGHGSERQGGGWGGAGEGEGDGGPGEGGLKPEQAHKRGREGGERVMGKRRWWG